MFIYNFKTRARLLISKSLQNTQTMNTQRSILMLQLLSSLAQLKSHLMSNLFAFQKWQLPTWTIWKTSHRWYPDTAVLGQEISKGNYGAFNFPKKAFFWKLPDTVTSFWNFLTFSGKSSSLIHYAALTIIGNDECQEKHYDNLEASDSEIDRELRENVNLILVSEKKISSEIICTRAPIEDLGTCPGGYKIIHPKQSGLYFWIPFSKYVFSKYWKKFWITYTVNFRFKEVFGNSKKLP